MWQGVIPPFSGDVAGHVEVLGDEGREGGERGREGEGEGYKGRSEGKGKRERRVIDKE